MNQTLVHLHELGNLVINQSTLTLSITALLCLNKEEAVKMIVSVVTIIVLNQILKSVLKMPLPEETPYGFTDQSWEEVTTETYSMPSGHTTLAMAFIINIIMRLNNIFKKHMLYLMISLCLLMILMVKCVLTWYMGYHYVQDVIVAGILTLSYVIIFEKTMLSKKDWISLARKYLVIVVLVFLLSLFMDVRLARLYPYILVISGVLLIPTKYLENKKCL